MADEGIVTFKEGPYVNAAFFCEQVIIGNDDILTPVRIIDRRTITAQGVGTPPTMPPQVFEVQLVIILKPGNAVGPCHLELVCEKPSGERLEPHRFDVLFDGGPDRGANVLIQIQMQADEAGLYWYDLMVDDRRITRIPFRVVYLTSQTG